MRCPVCMALGRVALLGDAAFVARPHVAAGITKAALDAAALAEELGASPGDISSALARYEAKRLSFGRALVDYSRKLGAASLAPDAIRDPERVMREYGAPHLVHDCLRLPPVLSAQNSETGKKQSAGHRLNRHCRPYAEPSSNSSLGYHRNDAHTAENGFAASSGMCVAKIV